MPVRQPLAYLLRRASQKGEARLYFYWQYDYERRAFSYDRRGRIEIYKDCRGKWILIIDDRGHDKYDRREYKHFGSLRRYLREWFNKNADYLVFLKPRKGGESKYYPLSKILGLALDEVSAWRVIFARSLGHLNFRRFYGVKVLGETTKKCELCGNRADMVLVFGWDNGRRYGRYYCRRCFMNHAVKEIQQHLERVMEYLVDGINEAIEGKLEYY